MRVNRIPGNNKSSLHSITSLRNNAFIHKLTLVAARFEFIKTKKVVCNMCTGPARVKTIRRFQNISNSLHRSQTQQCCFWMKYSKLVHALFKTDIPKGTNDTGKSNWVRWESHGQYSFGIGKRVFFGISGKFVFLTKLWQSIWSTVIQQFSIQLLAY